MQGFLVRQGVWPCHPSWFHFFDFIGCAVIAHCATQLLFYTDCASCGWLGLLYYTAKWRGRQDPQQGVFNFKTLQRMKFMWVFGASVILHRQLHSVHFFAQGIKHQAAVEFNRLR